jgi:transposase
MPLRMKVTAGNEADCTHAKELFEDLQAQYLLADKGYDSQEIVDSAQAQGMQAVIPPRSGRKQPRDYDRAIYKARHLVENAFAKLKQWRGIATRYAKNAASFLAAAQIRCTMLWLRIRDDTT